jgi:preprotein translocase subunit YajC
MLFSLAQTVLAFAPPPGGQQSTAPGWVNIVPLALMLVVFYFILIRPQQKKARQHQDLLKGLRAKDKIVTSGGIVGIVVDVRDKTVSIRSADTKLEILKSAVSEITERAGESAEARS